MGGALLGGDENCGVCLTILMLMTQCDHDAMSAAAACQASKYALSGLAP